MKTKLLFLLFFIVSVAAYSQEYIFGKVTSEFGDEMGNVVVINSRTDEKILTDKDGNFMISAKPFDELRFVKNGYERIIQKLSSENYSKPLNVILEKSPFVIEEVELAFTPTGNIVKDAKSLDPPKKVTELNRDMAVYMKTKPTEAAPKLTTPSAFSQPNYSAGQVNVLGVLSSIHKLFKKSTEYPLTNANYAETQEFYRRIKTTLDLSFYTKQGWDEEEIDRFLIYADQNFQLARKYRKNFNVVAIQNDMKMAYVEYVKTRKVKS